MKKFLLIALLAIITCQCQYFLGFLYGLQHDEKMAAKVAEDFAKFAFVEKDFTKAYSYVRSADKNDISLEKFQSDVEELHVKGFPQKIEATDYYALPEKGIAIFLEGKTDHTASYYMITLQGSKEKGYSVIFSLLIRQDHAFPEMKRRKHLK